MNKKLSVMLMLVLAQAACNLPLAARVQSTSVPNHSPRPSLTIAAPVKSPTDEDIQVAPPASPQPSQSISRMPEFTQTSSPTSTSEPATSTPTSSLTADGLFSSVVLSEQVIYLGCAPMFARFEVTSTRADVTSVVLFYRLQYKISAQRTSWNDGFSMKALDGKFTLDLQAANLKNFNKAKEPVAWVQYQLVATDRSGNILGRSQVFHDKLAISSSCP